MCKITVVIPAYNAVDVIGRMLDSVRKQSFEDWQAVVVDDGSADGTAGILDQYAAVEKRITVVHQPNCGVSAARNVGMQSALGDYLYFADADDELDADCLRLLFTAAQETKADLTVCGYSEVDNDGCTTRTWLPLKCHEVGAYCTDWIKRYGINTLCNKLFVRERICHQFDAMHAMGEDLKFVCDYLMDVQSIAVVERAMYIYYNKTPGSLTKNHALLMRAVKYDTGNLATLVTAQRVPAGVVADRFFHQMITLLKMYADREDFHRAVEWLMETDGLKEYSQRHKPSNLKLSIFRSVLNKGPVDLLYSLFAVNRYLSKA